MQHWVDKAGRDINESTRNWSHADSLRLTPWDYTRWSLWCWSFSQKILDDISPFLWGHCNPCSGLMVMSPYSHLAEVQHLLQHLLTSWQPAWQPSHSLPCTCEQALEGPKPRPIMLLLTGWDQAGRCSTDWAMAGWLMMCKPKKLTSRRFQVR